MGLSVGFGAAHGNLCKGSQGGLGFALLYGGRVGFKACLKDAVACLVVVFLRVLQQFKGLGLR